jgi:Holliday junction resolvase RusA-like endonuclease
VTQVLAVYHVTGVNPVPWKAASPGRGARDQKARGFSDEALTTYKKALKEEVVLQNSHLKMIATGMPVTIEFFFHRQLDQPNSKEADATNLQKSTEDALQGILYGNDKHNRDVRSVIVGQSADEFPHILIVVKPFDPAIARSEEALYPRPVYTIKSNINETGEDLF